MWAGSWLDSGSGELVSAAAVVARSVAVKMGVEGGEEVGARAGRGVDTRSWSRGGGRSGEEGVGTTSSMSVGPLIGDDGAVTVTSPLGSDCALGAAKRAVIASMSQIKLSLNKVRVGPWLRGKCRNVVGLVGW